MGLPHGSESPDADSSRGGAAAQTQLPSAADLDVAMHHVIDAAAWPMWLARLDGHCVHFNDGWLEMTGRTLQQELGWGWLENVHPDDQFRIKQTFIRAIEHFDHYLCRYRIRHHGKGYRWIEDSGRPVRSRDGTIVGYAGSAVDLSDQWQRAEQIENLARRSQRSAGEFEALIDAIPAIIWIAHDPKAKWITGNQAARDFLRLPRSVNHSLTPSSGKGHTHFEVFHDGSKLEADDLPIQKVAQTGIPIRNFEETIVFSDGSQYVMRGNVEPLVDSNGNRYGAVAAYVDLTDLKRTEELLRKSRQRLNQTIQDSMAGYFRLDSSGCYHEVNPAWLAMHGWDDADQVLGRHFSINHNTNTLDAMTALVHRLLSGQSVQGLEIAACAREGRTLFQTLSARPLQEKGRFSGIEGFVVDITASKEAEEALRQAHQLLEQRVADRTAQLQQANQKLQRTNQELNRTRHLLESMSHMLPGMVYLQNLGAGAILYANRDFQTFFLQDGRDYRHETIRDRVIPEDQPVFDQLFHRLRNLPADSTERCQAEVRARGDDEQEYRLHFSLGLFQADSESEQEILGVVLDVTDTRLAELATHRSDRLVALGTFTAGIAHELNNPLGTILMHIELMKQTGITEQSDAELYESVKTIGESVRRCSDIVKQVLDFSIARNETLEPLPSDEIVRFVTKVTKHVAQIAGATVQSDIPTDLPPVVGRRSQIEQVLINLIKNAIEAKATLITIDLRPDQSEPCLHFIIEDDGTGMTDRQLARVGDPFYTTRLDSGGTGLGLSICNRILHDHGTKLWIQSMPGKGTTIRFSLPLAGPADSSPPQPPESTVEPRP